MRTPLLATAFAIATASAFAQPAPATEREKLEPRKNQRIERIQVEDAGSRVDELRVGGETQAITVQPKGRAGLPAYEVRPRDGQRVWNVLGF